MSDFGEDSQLPAGSLLIEARYAAGSVFAAGSGTRHTDPLNSVPESLKNLDDHAALYLQAQQELEQEKANSVATPEKTKFDKKENIDVATEKAKLGKVKTGRKRKACPVPPFCDKKVAAGQKFKCDICGESPVDFKGTACDACLEGLIV